MPNQDSQALLSRAKERAEAGDFAQAIELSKRCLNQESANVESLILLGRSLTMLNRNDEAIQALKKSFQGEVERY